MKYKPKYSTIKERFGSWLNALIQANILEDGTRRTSRGTQCIAKDGDICFSLGEKTIDDFLFINGINHEKEAMYPQSNFRTDFKIGNVFIEYFGLIGSGNLMKKLKKKREMCKDNIYQYD